MSKSVSLVLGCGAARGLAHIGVIDVLEQQGFKIASVSGTSMGSLVGGLYAAGGLDEYREFVLSFRKVDFFKFLDLSPLGSSGMLKGDIIIDTLRNIVGDLRIEDLAMPYTAVAADINTGKEVWLQHGKLFDAVRASIAIPGVFTPHKVGHRLLVDGGIVNPVPVMPLSHSSTELTIAVDVNAPEADIPQHHEQETRSRNGSVYRQQIEKFFQSVQKRFDLEWDNKTEALEHDELGVTDILLRSFTTMQTALTRYKLAANQPDVLISIPRNICEVHEFYKAEQVIEQGAWWAQRALETAKI